MKTTNLLSLFLLGLFVTGMVHAQEMGDDMPMMAEPTMIIMDEEMPAVNIMSEEGRMDQMMRIQKDSEFGNKTTKEWGDRGECPMKQMFGKNYSHHSYGGWSFLWGILHGICMLVFLFLGAFVIRKGWELAGCCCGKSCKK